MNFGTILQDYAQSHSICKYQVYVLLEARYGTWYLLNISIHLYITYILSFHVTICKPMFATTKFCW
jgi:hypothetical protein